MNLNMEKIINEKEILNIQSAINENSVTSELKEKNTLGKLVLSENNEEKIIKEEQITDIKTKYYILG